MMELVVGRERSLEAGRYEREGYQALEEAHVIY
jgi:hypothetical protein